KLPRGLGAAARAGGREREVGADGAIRARDLPGGVRAPDEVAAGVEAPDLFAAERVCDGRRRHELSRQLVRVCLRAAVGELLPRDAPVPAVGYLLDRS